MSSNALFIHIPVDMIRIELAPNYFWWSQLYWNKDSQKNGKATFTLRTSASKASFRRKIEIAEVWPSSENGRFAWAFTAVFCGTVVSGYYQPHLQTGWFNRD